MQSIKLYVILLLTTLTIACQKESNDSTYTPKGTLTLAFEHSVRTWPLTFNTNYTNDLGEDYTVNRFRYYLHDIKLINNKGAAISLSKEHYFVKHEDMASRQLAFTADTGTYTSIVYTLGVDSIRNFSGAQTDALDPLNGMFWTWASGYIMAKLEGNSPVSNQSGRAFTWHVGGFKAPNKTMRTIILPLQGNMTIAKEATTTVTINADINTWFSHLHAISIAATPICHSPSELANNLADNYSGMFSVKQIQ